MKEILTSVNKEHLDNILDGIKTIEWRKKPLPLGKHYGYETKNKGGCGKVTGEFYIVENIKVYLFDIVCNDPKDLIKRGCVDWEFLNKYAGKQDFLYANIIENEKRYDKPKELSEFYKPVKYDNVCGAQVVCCGHYQGLETVDYCEYNDGDCSLKGCKELRNLYKIKRSPQSWCYVEVSE